MQEVEAVCDRVVIIDHGKIVADSTTANLSGLSANNLQFQVEFKEDVPQDKILEIPYVARVEKTSKNTWLIETNGKKDIREQIFKFAVANKYNVLSLSQNELKMEDVFHSLTNQ